jgi:hypothetical protein
MCLYRNTPVYPFHMTMVWSSKFTLILDHKSQVLSPKPLHVNLQTMDNHHEMNLQLSDLCKGLKVSKKHTEDKISVTRDSFIASVAFLSNACSNTNTWDRVSGQLKHRTQATTSWRTHYHVQTKKLTPSHKRSNYTNRDNYHPQICTL